MPHPCGCSQGASAPHTARCSPALHGAICLLLPARPTAPSCLHIAACTLLPAPCPPACCPPHFVRCQVTREPTSPGILPGHRAPREPSTALRAMGGPASWVRGALQLAPAARGRACVRLRSGCRGAESSCRQRSTICAALALPAAAWICCASPCPPSSPGLAAPAAPAARARRSPASLLPALPPSPGVFQLLATVLSQKASAQESAVGDGPAKAQDIPAGGCRRPPGCREREQPWPCRGPAGDPGTCLFFYCHGPRRQKKNVWVKNDSLAFRLLPGLLLPRLVGTPRGAVGSGGDAQRRGRAEGWQRSLPGSFPSLAPRQPRRSPRRGLLRQRQRRPGRGELRAGTTPSRCPRCGGGTCREGRRMDT